MYKPPLQIKKGWVAVSNTGKKPPTQIGETQIVEVMAADGGTRIGEAGSFDWDWHSEEQNRICQYRLLSRFAVFSSDELLAFISKTNATISEHEALLAGARLELKAAFSDLNRRLQDECGVTLNDIMHIEGQQKR